MIIEKIEKMKSENWIAVSNFPNYEVSETGKVKNKSTGLVLKQSKTSQGYKVVSLYNNGLKKTQKVHRLVATAFVYKPKGKNVVNHKDLDKANNHKSNLEWLTQAENVQHASIKKGGLTISDVKRIRILLNSKSQAAIAKMYNVSPGMICHIKAGRKWSTIN